MEGVAPPVAKLYTVELSCFHGGEVSVDDAEVGDCARHVTVIVLELDLAPSL